MPTSRRRVVVEGVPIVEAEAAVARLPGHSLPVQLVRREGEAQARDQMVVAVVVVGEVFVRCRSS